MWVGWAVQGQEQLLSMLSECASEHILSSVNHKTSLLYSWGKKHVASFRALLF